MSSRWVSKPPVGSVIDWGNPLSKGLVGAWLMNEGGGNVVKDLVNPNSDSVPISGSQIGEWKNSTYGKILSTTITSKGFKTNILTLSDFSFVTLAKTNNAGSYIVKHNAQNHYIIGVYTNTQLCKISTTNFFGNKILTTGVWYQHAFTRNGGIKVKLYLNGSSDGGGDDNSAITPDLYQISSTGNVDYVYFYIWDRALSPSEIKSLYESPYQFIKGPSTITYFTPPAVGGWVWGGEVKNVMVA